jgi:hypothetical protein
MDFIIRVFVGELVMAEDLSLGVVILQISDIFIINNRSLIGQGITSDGETYT